MSDLLPVHVPYAALQLIYIGLCLVGIGAVFALQAGRHARAKSCLYWSFTALAFGLGWEAIDAWKYGVPGWPGSRWILLPALDVVMIWAALDDWREQRRAVRTRYPE